VRRRGPSASPEAERRAGSPARWGGWIPASSEAARGASAQREVQVHSLLCRRADCPGCPFRGQEHLPQASARDRACTNQAFGPGSIRQSTQNCGPSGPGFGRFSQAGFGWSVSKLTEPVLEAGSSSGPSEAAQRGYTPPARRIGSPAQPPQRQQLACESHAEGAVPRNCPAWKALAVSSETSAVRTRLPLGAARSSSDAESASRPIARTSALPAVTLGSPLPREQWSSTAGS
jgi:hypothetical protein